MLMKSIKDVKKGIASDSNRYRIYIIHTRTEVLYVGKSRCALTRMESHVGKGEWFSFFGGNAIDYELIKKEADCYMVQFYSEEEVDAAIDRQCDIDSKVNWMEEILISILAPKYNVIGNNHRPESAGTIATSGDAGEEG